MTDYLFASDPHGRGNPWIKRIENMRHKHPHAYLIFGGDYIDVGPDSKDILAYIINLEKRGKAKALLGNHEQMLLDMITYDDQTMYQTWLQNGGSKTVMSLIGLNTDKASYQTVKTAIIQRYNQWLVWLLKLPTIIETDQLLFVHAGLNLSKPNPVDQTPILDQLWLREKYWYGASILSQTHHTWAHNPLAYTIITGHTPTCLVTGQYDYETQNKKFKRTDRCPIKIVQYPEEKARIFTDGGCHSLLPNHDGNIVLINEAGQVLDKLE